MGIAPHIPQLLGALNAGFQKRFLKPFEVNEESRVW
jgi:hypothetical protein